MESNLTIIPAKIGSTRLPKKNIRLLGDKPLISYTINAAFASDICGEIMVSTESPEIAEISRNMGAKVPFMRPEHLGKDPYGVVDVCMHVLGEYEKRGSNFKKLIILLPTSPFRTEVDIWEANKIFDGYKANFLMSVSEFEHNPFGALRFQEDSDNIMIPTFPEHIGKKRHEIPKTYSANGAICILDVQAFKKAGTYYGNPLYTYTMPWNRSIDIDTEMDLKFAEFLLQIGKG
ncbi:MAG: acylneuraminate cytidylyltransferase family protein [Deltaproteobacteria bacterium]|nr:acylneuraminate cytidylyltransferase family protein [Deltaproteobacteria bacterium]